MSEEIKQWLAENLRLEISEEDHYTYCGGEGSMYTTYKKITLVLEEKVISEITFN